MSLQDALEYGAVKAIKSAETTMILKQKMEQQKKLREEAQGQNYPRG